MTRKEALQKAILYLRELYDNTLQETIEELERVVLAVPITQWDFETITDAVEEFYIKNDRLPFSSEFKGGELPSHGSLMNRLQLNPNEFLKIYFPEAYETQGKKNYVNKYRYKPAEYWVEQFTDFMKKNPAVTSKTYDYYRKPGMPHSKTLLALADVKTWNQLLFKAGLPIKYTSKSINHVTAVTLDRGNVTRSYANLTIDELTLMINRLERGNLYNKSIR